MNEQAIRIEYTKKALEIESHWMEQDVPRSIRELYLMVELIQLRCIEKYFMQFGWQIIDSELACVGKNIMRWGHELSDFEIDSIQLLNMEITRREHERKHPTLALPASSIRTIVRDTFGSTVMLGSSQ